MIRKGTLTAATPPNPPLGLAALLAARLRRWRQGKGLPLKQMALDLNLSISIISAWENGTRFPSVAHLEQLSTYLGIPVCQLLYPGEGDCASTDCWAPHGMHGAATRCPKPNQRACSAPGA